MNVLDVFGVASTLMGLYMILSVGRLIVGPTAADRAVALDTINTLVVAVMLVLAVKYDSVVMVDVALVYAGLSFVSTMFLARYIERRGS